MIKSNSNIIKYYCSRKTIKRTTINFVDKYVKKKIIRNKTIFVKDLSPEYKKIKSFKKIDDLELEKIESLKKDDYNYIIEKGKIIKKNTHENIFDVINNKESNNLKNYEIKKFFKNNSCIKKIDNIKTVESSNIKDFLNKNFTLSNKNIKKINGNKIKFFFKKVKTEENLFSLCNFKKFKIIKNLKNNFNIKNSKINFNLKVSDK